MRKRPFLTFVAVVGALVVGTTSYIQSAHFARLVKGFAARYVPKDLGIEGDFSEFAIKLFPPGVSIKNPRLSVQKKNILNLPEGSSVQAERLDFNFRPFQMFSGDIRVHQVVIVNGDVKLILDPDAPARKAVQTKGWKPEIHWDELLKVHAEGVLIENARLQIETRKDRKSLTFLAKSMELSQWFGRGGIGYFLAMELEQVTGNLLADYSLPELIESMKGELTVNPLGVKVGQIYAKAHGVELTASGDVRGNLLKPKGLNADLSIRGTGEIGDMLRLARQQGRKKLAGEGNLTFSGKLRGNLEDLTETAKADGTLVIRDFQLQGFKADQVEADAGFEASAGGGEISIKKATITAKEGPRAGGFQPGAGGRVELGPVKFALGSPQPIHLPLKLERAHIHWLGAPALKDLYPLDFRVSGPIDATFSLPAKNRPWNAGVKMDLGIDEFQLDNQRLGQAKPLKRILKIPHLALSGTIGIEPTGIRVDGLDLSLPKSKLHAEGRVDFKTGYDLRAQGPIDFSDIGMISENEIRGVGTLGVRVHGPSSRVLIDFDPDVQNASYLKLEFGSLKGRFTWDDDPQNLLIQKVRATKNLATTYTVDGKLELGNTDRIGLNVSVPQGDIQDFVQIFGHLTAGLDWFPRAIAGPMNGDIRVNGGLNLNQLQVLAHVNGSNWEYWSERWRSITLTGGYDRGKYYLSEFKGIKRTGGVNGRISYDQNGELAWDLHSNGLSVSDLDHIAQLDVPIRGRMVLTSQGKGKAGAIESRTEIAVTDVSVRGLGYPSSQLTLKTQSGIARLLGSALGGQGVVDLLYDFNPSGESYFQAELKQLDFSPMLLLLNPKSISDPSLTGLVSGSLNLTFHSGRAERATGLLEVSDYQLARNDTRFKLVKPVSVKIADGSFEIPELAVQGRQSVAKLQLASRKASLDGSVSGNLDLSLVEFFTSSVQQANGAASLDLSIEGTLKEPVLFGKATVNGALVRVPSVDSPFENVSGTFQLKQNRVSIQNLESELAGGRVSAGGTVDLFATKYPGVSLKARLSGPKIKVYPFQFIKLGGSLAIHGDEPPYLIDGSLVVDSALSKEKVLNQKQGSGLKALQYGPPASQRRDTNFSLFKLNINVLADRGVMIQNDLFDAEAKGNLTLVNTLEAPRLLGTAEVIRGKFVFNYRAFQIQNASASFDSPTVINPSFSLNAATDVNGTKVQLYATGRMEKWKAELTSTPPMPESEILNLLTVGLTSSDAKKLSTSDRTTVERSEAISLLLNSADFNRELQNKTGFEVQLDESVNPQQGQSAFRPQAADSTAAAPRIVIKRRVVKDLDVSVGSTVGVGSNAETGANVEWHLNQVAPGLSIMGVYDNYETVDTQDKGTSIGADVKWQHKWK